MKVTKFASLMMISLALAVVATGCKSPQGVRPITPLRPVGQTGGDGQDMGGERLPMDDGMGGQGTTATPANAFGSHTGYARDPKFFQDDIVYFAYDSSAIRSGEKSKITAVATHLKDNPTLAVEVEGHCDERGTDQYNMALGERRALAVREALVAEGIEASRVDTVSYGRTRPADTGHSDAAHARNRRGAFVLLTPPTQ